MPSRHELRHAVDDGDGFLRSWETVFTKSFFICSRCLSRVMSRRIAATPDRLAEWRGDEHEARLGAGRRAAGARTVRGPATNRWRSGA